MAYKLWTWRIHGRRDRNNRRVIPSCVLKAIRYVHPEPNQANYSSFEKADVDAGEPLWPG